MATRELNKWTLTDGTPQPDRLKGKTYPAYKERMIVELKLLGVKHYYADVAVIDLGTDVYKGYTDKIDVKDYALVMFSKVVSKYRNSLVKDDGPIME